jgi:hypothetical protein
VPFKDPEKQKLYDKKYYDTHPYTTEQKERARQYRETNREQLKIRRQAYALANRLYVRSVKEGAPCTDCRESYPYYVMQFDHIPGRGEKKFEVAVPTTRSRKSIDAEIAKCEIVCANCHMERTHGLRKSNNDGTSNG